MTGNFRGTPVVIVCVIRMTRAVLMIPVADVLSIAHWVCRDVTSQSGRSLNGGSRCSTVEGCPLNISPSGELYEYMYADDVNKYELDEA